MSGSQNNLAIPTQAGSNTGSYLQLLTSLNTKLPLGHKCRRGPAALTRKNCTTSSPEAGILYLAVANTCQNQARTAVDHSTRQSVEKRRFTDLLLEIFCIGRSTATAANSHMENVNRLLITPSTSKILLFSAVQHPVCPS
ncbi:uncharacterized protein LOC143808128 isoform X1 [Ranitomeya variabilis]|uniref:uncharacterized protein LOC143808128 isoform X1 n=1 Tax=Ranitomeya variabilis TaxID=490064 RepID=UPI004056517A